MNIQLFIGTIIGIIITVLTIKFTTPKIVIPACPPCQEVNIASPDFDKIKIAKKSTINYTNNIIIKSDSITFKKIAK